MKTNRQELILNLRRALGQLESPSHDGEVELEVLDLEYFAFTQEFLDEVVSDAIQED